MKPLPSINRKLWKKRIRPGVAIAEFAIITPVFVLVCLATIDICNFIHFKQKLNCVAFEACRTATRPHGDYVSGAEWGRQVAQMRGIQGCVVHVGALAPNQAISRSDLPLGAPVEAVATASVNPNMPGPFILFRGSNATSQRVRVAASRTDERD